MVFVTETHCVYCAVRAEYIYICVIRITSLLQKGRALDHAGSRRPVTDEARDRCQVRQSVRFVVDSLALGQVFSEYLGLLLPASSHQCSIPIFIYILLLLEGQTVETWEPSKSSAVEDVGKHWIEILFVFHRCSVSGVYFCSCCCYNCAKRMWAYHLCVTFLFVTSAPVFAPSPCFCNSRTTR